MEVTAALLGKVPEEFRAAVGAAGFEEAPPAEADMLVCVGVPSARAKEQLRRALHEGRCAIVMADADEAGKLAEEFPVFASPLADFELNCLLRILSRLSRLARERGRERAEIRGLTGLREELLSVASHDLRTPVTSLKLLADLIEASTPELEGEMLGGLSLDELVETMRRNLSRMEKLISDILEISRLYRGAREIELAPVDINEMVGEVAASLFPMAMGKDIVLDAELAPRLPRVCADGARASQVVMNLVDNALKYTPPGGTVTVRTLENEGGAVIEVADTGPGIPEEEQRGIFERFGRGTSKATGGETSTGLGLYICREIMQLHGGKIWLESTPGQGSRFFVLFPKGGGDDS